MFFVGHVNILLSFSHYQFLLYSPSEFRYSILSSTVFVGASPLLHFDCFRQIYCISSRYRCYRQRSMRVSWLPDRSVVVCGWESCDQDLSRVVEFRLMVAQRHSTVYKRLADSLFDITCMKTCGPGMTIQTWRTIVSQNRKVNDFVVLQFPMRAWRTEKDELDMRGFCVAKQECWELRRFSVSDENMAVRVVMS